MLMFKFKISYFDKFIKHMIQEQVRDNFESEHKRVKLWWNQIKVEGKQIGATLHVGDSFSSLSSVLQNNNSMLNFGL